MFDRTTTKVTVDGRERVLTIDAAASLVDEVARDLAFEGLLGPNTPLVPTDEAALELQFRIATKIAQLGSRGPFKSPF